jgi:hypothetical protein
MIAAAKDTEGLMRRGGADAKTEAGDGSVNLNVLHPRVYIAYCDRDAAEDVLHHFSAGFLGCESGFSEDRRPFRSLNGRLRA